MKAKIFILVVVLICLLLSSCNFNKVNDTSSSSSNIKETNQSSITESQKEEPNPYWICPAPESTYISAKFSEKRPATYYCGIVQEFKYTKVVAAQNGVVLKEENDMDKGKLITIDHGNGYVATYKHLSYILVQKGQTVKQGETIGKVGNTGGVGGAALGFEVTLNGKPIDGETLMKK